MGGTDFWGGKAGNSVQGGAAVLPAISVYRVEGVAEHGMAGNRCRGTAGQPERPRLYDPGGEELRTPGSGDCGNADDRADRSFFDNGAGNGGKSFCERKP